MHAADHQKAAQWARAQCCEPFRSAVKRSCVPQKHCRLCYLRLNIGGWLLPHSYLYTRC